MSADETANNEMSKEIPDLKTEASNIAFRQQLKRDLTAQKKVETDPEAKKVIEESLKQPNKKKSINNLKVTKHEKGLPGNANTIPPFGIWPHHIGLPGLIATL